MRLLALLKASFVASLVFSLAWLRHPLSIPHWMSLFWIFLGYGVALGLLAVAIGWPLAILIERMKADRWWSYAAVAAALGGTTAALVVPYDQASTPDPNPFAPMYSPWTRDLPGFVGTVPGNPADYLGSVVFCAMVGGVLGFAYWYFNSHRVRPNAHEERRL